MLTNLRKIVEEHIKDNVLKYFFLALSIIVGVVAGALFVTALSEQNTKELSNTISSFCNIAVTEDILAIDIFKQAMISNVRNVLIIWLCGLTVYLIPLTFFILGAKGFSYGFTLGFMSLNFGFKGFLFATVSILPQIIIIVPALLFLGALSVDFALKRRTMQQQKSEEKKALLSFTYSVVIIFIFILLGVLIDTFVTPVFIKMISASII